MFVKIGLKIEEVILNNFEWFSVFLIRGKIKGIYFFCYEYYKVLILFLVMGKKM